MVEKLADTGDTGLDREAVASPFREVAGLRRGGKEAAGFRGGIAAVAVDQVVVEGAGPGLPGLQRDGEAEAPVGVGGWRISFGADGDGAGEDAVVVGGREFETLVGPGRVDAAAADVAAGFDLENVGEVAADGEFEVEGDGGAAVVADLEALVHAAVDEAGEDEAEGAGGNIAGLGGELAVGEEDFRGVVGGGAAVDELPGLAVGVEGVGTDDAGVEEIEALIGGPCHLAVQIGEEDGVALVDRELRRADFDLDRHQPTPSRFGTGTRRGWVTRG